MSAANADQARFWSEDAGPVWAAQSDPLDQVFAPVSDLILARAGLATGDHVMDVGCGAGGLTRLAAAQVGNEAQVTGLDISAPLLAVARERSGHLGHIRYVEADAQTHAFDPHKDHLLSRFGVMFFDAPEAAFANMMRALTTGGTVVFATWGQIAENPFFTCPARVAKEVFGPRPKTDPDAPGPFSLRDPARAAALLDQAGLQEVAIEPVQVSLRPAGDAEALARFFCDVGPARGALTHFEADADGHARLLEALTRALEAFQTKDGLAIPAEVNLLMGRKAA